MTKSTSLSINLDPITGRSIAQMAKTLGQSSEEFLSALIVDWLTKPKRFKRLAKRRREQHMRDKVALKRRMKKSAGLKKRKANKSKRSSKATTAADATKGGITSASG